MESFQKVEQIQAVVLDNKENKNIKENCINFKILENKGHPTNQNVLICISTANIVEEEPLIRPKAAKTEGIRYFYVKYFVKGEQSPIGNELISHAMRIIFLFFLV